MTLRNRRITTQARLCPACGGTGQRQRDTFGTPSVVCFWCGGRGVIAGLTR